MNVSKYKAICFLALFGTSCNKITSIKTEAIASVNIVNVINGGGGVKLNLNRDIVNNNTYQIQAIDAGSGNIKAYDAVNNAVYYNQPQETVNGGLYSLYLTGTATAPVGVWIKDSIKPYGTENTTTTVRIANMSPDAGAVSVNLASATGTKVFNNIAYKSVTDFKDFPLPLTIPENTNVFEFRNGAGTLLASFTLPESARNRCYTIVLKGMVGSTIGAIGQQHY